MPRDSEQLLNTSPKKDPTENTRDAILLALQSKTKFVGAGWDGIVARGIMTKQDVHLDPHTWIGETRISAEDPTKYTIHLGTRDIPEALGEQVIFRFKQLSPEDRLLYRLSHELCHVVCPIATETDREFGRLFSMLEVMRRNGHAMSSLGNLDMYRTAGSVVQATEDLVELTNMFMIDPEYLRAYFVFLSDPLEQRRRDALRLHHLQSERIANMLFALIEDGVTRFLKSP